MNMLTLSIALGIAVILQGGLNKQLMHRFGLFEVAMVNSFVVLIFSIVFFLLAERYAGELAPELRNKGNLLKQVWWIFIPGLMGILIVTGVPYGFFRFGALNVFVVFVCTQIIGSMLWDLWVEKIPLTPIRIASTAVALLSVVLMLFDQKKS